MYICIDLNAYRLCQVFVCGFLKISHCKFTKFKCFFLKKLAYK